jgi:hypothetical protein
MSDILDKSVPVTREELIQICEKAIVPQKLWSHRGSELAQKEIGRCWQLLKCGCEFEIRPTNKPDRLIWEKNFIELQFWAHNEEWFDHGDNPHSKSEHSGFILDSEAKLLLFLIPTTEFLDKAKGADWYPLTENTVADADKN